MNKNTTYVFCIHIYISVRRIRFIARERQIHMYAYRNYRMFSFNSKNQEPRAHCTHNGVSITTFCMSEITIFFFIFALLCGFHRYCKARCVVNMWWCDMFSFFFFSFFFFFFAIDSIYHKMSDVCLWVCVAYNQNMRAKNFKTHNSRCVFGELCICAGTFIFEICQRWNDFTFRDFHSNLDSTRTSNILNLMAQCHFECDVHSVQVHGIVVCRCAHVEW